jgi:hypothetical protein
VRYVVIYVIIVRLVVVMLVNTESDHKFNHIGAWEMKSQKVEIYFVPICMSCVLWFCVPVVSVVPLSICLIDETQHDTEI